MDGNHSDPDEFAEYLLGNLKDLIAEHGHPTPKLLETIVEELIKSMMWEKESLDSIMKIWWKFPPFAVQGAIGAFQSVFMSISRGKMDLYLTPRYIQIFTDAPTLRIPRNIASERTRRFLSIIEDDELWTYFFRSRSDEGFGEGICAEHKGFLFDKILEETVDRIALIRLMVIKAIFVFMTVDDGKYLFDCIHCIMAALQNCLIIVPVIRDGRIEKKRKWDDTDSGLSSILTILGRPSFYNTMLKAWVTKRNR